MQRRDRTLETSLTPIYRSHLLIRLLAQPQHRVWQVASRQGFDCDVTGAASLFRAKRHLPLLFVDRDFYALRINIIRSVVMDKFSKISSDNR